MPVRPVLAIVLLTLMLARCRSGAADADDLQPGNTYLDYAVTGEEGLDAVCKLQYRAGGQEGAAFAAAPGSVMLDGQPLPPDSSRFSGVYYESSRPSEGFAGSHSILLTGSDGKKYAVAFDFHPFRLAAELPDSLRRQAFAIRLEGLPAGAVPLRVVLADGAFYSKWVNEVVMVYDGRLVITSRMLSGLAAGAVGLELYLEQEKALAVTGKGGRLAVTYGLKREFVLVK